MSSYKRKVNRRFEKSRSDPSARVRNPTLVPITSPLLKPSSESASRFVLGFALGLGTAANGTGSNFSRWSNSASKSELGKPSTEEAIASFLFSPCYTGSSYFSVLRTSVCMLTIFFVQTVSMICWFSQFKKFVAQLLLAPLLPCVPAYWVSNESSFPVYVSATILLAWGINLDFAYLRKLVPTTALLH